MLLFADKQVTAGASWNGSEWVSTFVSDAQGAIHATIALSTWRPGGLPLFGSCGRKLKSLTVVVSNPGYHASRFVVPVRRRLRRTSDFQYSLTLPPLELDPRR